MPGSRGLDTAQDRGAKPFDSASFEQLVGRIAGGRYRLDRILGLGGMGCVFEATDLRLKRRVALKLALPGLGEGLIAEARSLACVTHPGVVTVHDFGEHESVPYLVMERIYGISLEDHLRKREDAGALFGLAESLDVLAAAAEAVGAVHRAGVVHRDIKPSNLMIAAGHRVVLMDFGLTHAEWDEHARTAVAGTPQYMAPEVIRGELVPGIAYLADIYALGVLAWRVLTGGYPYDGATEEIFRLHLHTPTPLVSELRPDAPPALVKLVAAMMSKDLADRPLSADDVARELREIQRRLDAPPLRERFSVLVVDDDPDAAKLFSLFVREAAPGCHVRTAGSGQQAIELVRAEPPDLMLVDLDMPGMNGLELCLFLRGTPLADACRVVIMSGAASDDDVRLLYQLGLTHFVPKRKLAREQVLAITQDVKRAFDAARARADAR